jgi:hypothetical protein
MTSSTAASPAVAASSTVVWMWFATNGSTTPLSWILTMLAAGDWADAIPALSAETTTAIAEMAHTTTTSREIRVRPTGVRP